MSYYSRSSGRPQDETVQVAVYTAEASNAMSKPATLAAAVIWTVAVAGVVTLLNAL